MLIVSKENIPRQQIIRYAGNKSKLLDLILPTITKELKAGQTFFDLFAGTHAVGYALKNRNKIFSNDVQRYSWAIGKALIEGNESVTIESAKREILPHLTKISEGYTLFEEKFAGSYFSLKQCKEIDRIRSAVDKADISEHKKYSYLCCLMYAMSNLASTTGYFAQYLAANKTRNVRRKSILKAFLTRCSKFDLITSPFENKCFNNEYSNFFSDPKLQEHVDETDLVYADPPYSAAQYSRYYHVLETLIKYDYPELVFKGRYRSDRYQSGFCQTKKVKDEFEKLFFGVASFDKPLLLSYVNSGSGLLPEKEVVELAESNFLQVGKPIKLDYNHSRLGNGKPIKVEEFLLVCK